MMSDPTAMTLAEARDAIRAKKISAKELTGAFVKAIEAARQVFGAEVDLQHPAAARPGGRRRGVEDRCGVEPDIARLRQAFGHAQSRDLPFDLAGGHTAEPVRARRNPERRVVGIDRVEVNSRRGHGLNDRERRLDVQQAVLHRPRPEARRLDTFLDDDGAILVPAEIPVG